MIYLRFDGARKECEQSGDHQYQEEDEQTFHVNALA